MIYLDRKDIDIERWDACVAKDQQENIFCYSWYLDAVSENWGALLSPDYSTLIPIPYTTKLGVKRFYQAPFTREYAIFGTDFGWKEVIEHLKNNFGHIDFRSANEGLTETYSSRVHQQLPLNSSYEEEYRSNAKRLIKKGHKLFQIQQMNEPEKIIALFRETVAHKIESIGEADLSSLTELMNNAVKNNQGEMLGALDENNEFVAGGFFLKDKKRVTYLKGASANEAKKNGAMYALFDFAFSYFKTAGYETFDFGGSDVENVATFYKKFGATDRNYYNYTIDLTPLWFKTLKRFKKG